MASGPTLICVTGPDGAGKTTQIARIAEALSKRGKKKIVAMTIWDMLLDPSTRGRVGFKSPLELDSFLDLILRVTGPAPGDDDLVTLLWDANLPHIVVETVPLEGEADGGAESVTEEPTVAWPKQQAGGLALGSPQPSDEPSAGRSDDWSTNEHQGDTDQLFDQLESVAIHEIARFQQEHENAAAEPVASQALRVLQDCAAGELDASDREVLAEFVPRVLRESLGLGQWAQASTALRLLRGFDPNWSLEDFAVGLSGPFAVTTRRSVAALDQQDSNGVEAFLTLARELGSEAVRSNV